MIADQIRNKIIETATSYPIDEEVAAFVDAFKAKYGDNLEGVVFYGSCLTAKMRKPTSFRDFFVLVREYKPIASSALKRFVLSFMPPNLFFVRINHNGREIEAKYHFLTLNEFKRVASINAPDHYIIGRMCKRTALLWAKDDAARDGIVNALADAFFSNAKRALPLIAEPVDFKAFVMTFLRFSYMSELRLETDDKIEQIYNSEKELYDALYGMLADLLIESGELNKSGEKFENSGDGKSGDMYLLREKSGDMYSLRVPRFTSVLQTRTYLWKSKFRHIARFPKMIFAMDNWLDQLLGKYERTHGRKINLSDFEKRHRLLTAVKYFYLIKVVKKLP